MINEELMRHIAELSKIEFTDGELAQITKEMASIASLMDKVRDFDVPTQPYTPNASRFGDLRNDEYGDSYPTDTITRNAKIVRNNNFTVPKVIK